jgi:hypothetical protein
MALIATLLLPTFLIAADNKACKLLTAAELEPVVGGKLAAFKAFGWEGVDQCYASTGNATVVLRWDKQKNPTSEGPSARVAKHLAMLKEAGATVDVKTFGAVTCFTLIPSKSMPTYGLDTFCMVSKGDEVASVLITVWTEKDLVPIDKLHPLAEKMAGRF